MQAGKQDRAWRRGKGQVQRAWQRETAFPTGSPGTCHWKGLSELDHVDGKDLNTCRRGGQSMWRLDQSPFVHQGTPAWCEGNAGIYLVICLFWGERKSTA